MFGLTFFGDICIAAAAYAAGAYTWPIVRDRASAILAAVRGK